MPSCSVMCADTFSRSICMRPDMTPFCREGPDSVGRQQGLAGGPHTQRHCKAPPGPVHSPDPLQGPTVEDRLPGPYPVDALSSLPPPPRPNSSAHISLGHLLVWWARALTQWGYRSGLAGWPLRPPPPPVTCSANPGSFLRHPSFPPLGADKRGPPPSHGQGVPGMAALTRGHVTRAGRSRGAGRRTCLTACCSFSRLISLASRSSVRSSIFSMDTRYWQSSTTTTSGCTARIVCNGPAVTLCPHLAQPPGQPQRQHSS